MVTNCAKSRNIFGVTIDKVGFNQYSAIWAFKLDPQKAKHEGFGATKVNGQLNNDPEYPGCPYCGSKEFIFCSCGAVSCYNGEKSSLAQNVDVQVK